MLDNRPERKLAILKLSRTHAPEQVAEILGISKQDVHSMLKESLREIEEKQEDLGRSFMYLELERIEEVKRIMIRFIDDFQAKVQVTDEGQITETAERAFNMVMAASDRLDKYLQRTSKLLGLDAPTKLAAVSEMREPSKILEAAMALDKEEALTQASLPPDFDISRLA